MIAAVVKPNFSASTLAGAEAPKWSSPMRSPHRPVKRSQPRVVPASTLARLQKAGGSTLSGTYKPDGQTTSPLSSASSFAADGGSITLDAVGTGFGTMNPNGRWTLFFADVVAGGGKSSLSGWSLDITAVPEPVNMALGLFGVLFAGAIAVRRWLTRKAVSP